MPLRLLIQPVLIMSALAFLALNPWLYRPDPNTEIRLDAGALMEHLTFVLGDDPAPHPPGSLENAAVRGRLLTRLVDMGMQPEVQQQFVCRESSRVSGIMCGEVANVLVRIGGDGPAIAVTTHYDSQPASIGAADAGAGVAALIEIGKHLVGRELKHPVLLVFNDSEEFGLLGAQALMQHRWAEDIALLINLEARGSTGPVVLFEATEGSGPLLDAFSNAAGSPNASSAINAVYDALPNTTDLAVFEEHGVTGVNLAIVDMGYLYHTLDDNPANLSDNSLAALGGTAASMVEHLQQLPELVTTESPGIYGGVLQGLMWRAPDSLVIPISLALLLVTLLVAYAAIKRGRLSPLALIRGLVTPWLVITAAAALGWAINQMGLLLSGYQLFWYAHPTPYQIVIYALAAWAVVTLYGKTSVDARLVGLLFFGNVLVFLMGLWAPGLSSIMFLAAVFALLGGAALALRRITGLKPSYVVILPGLAWFLGWADFLWFVEVARGLREPPVLAALTASSLLPLALLGPVHKKYGIALILIAGLSFIVTLAGPAYSPDRPQRVSLEYVHDQRNESFAWQVTGTNDRLPKELAQAFGAAAPAASAIPGLAEAKHFVSSQHEVPSAPIRLEQDVQPAPSGGWVIDLQWHKGDEDWFRLLLPADVTATRVSIGSVTANLQPDRPFRGHHHMLCISAHCASRHIRIWVDDLPEQASAIVLTETYGLPDPLNSIIAKRGANAMPYNHGDVTLTIAEFPLARPDSN